MPREPLDANLDPQTLAALKMAAKRQLRTRMRSLRQALPAHSISQRSRRIVERIIDLPLYRSARSVALYAPMVGRGEVELREIDVHARSEGKRVYYPFIDVDSSGQTNAGFRLVESLDDLAERGHAFAEPPLVAPEAGPGEIDMIIVPALAVDADGHRLGQGSGFYDRVVPRYRPPAIAVAVVYDFQRLAELPTLPHDVRCDIVIDDKATKADE